jgi:hypothetical protein
MPTNTYYIWDKTDERYIGYVPQETIYKSKKNARIAIKRLKKRPTMATHKFEIHECEANVIYIHEA